MVMDITVGWLILTVDGANALVTTGLAKIVVGSLTVLSALLDGGSPPPLTLAVLSNNAGAFASTLTTTLIAAVLLAPGKTPVRLQVTNWPAKPQDHPAPLALRGDKPAGNGSVTTILEPSVAPLPTLLTTRLYVAVVWPWKKLPTWLLASVRLGAPTARVACAGTCEVPACTLVTPPAGMALSKLPMLVGTTATTIWQLLLAGIMPDAKTMEVKFTVTAPQVLAAGEPAVVKPAGKLSVTPTPVTTAELSLNKVMVKVTVWPTLAEIGLNALVTRGLLKIWTVSVAPLLFCADKGSLPPTTLAVFTNEAGAVLLTLTVMVKDAVAPAGKLAAYWQVTVCPMIVHWFAACGPQPAPPAAKGVKPVGNTSVTSMAPKVAPAPWLVAVMVKLAVL